MSTVPAMVRGRPPAYTPEMDALILTTSSNLELSQRFEREGWGAHSPKAIGARRAYLKKTGLLGNGASPAEQRLVHLKAIQRTIGAQLTEVDERKVMLQEQFDAISEEIRSVLKELNDGA